jgi:hypothetical protein
VTLQFGCSPTPPAQTLRPLSSRARFPTIQLMHVYEVIPRNDHRGFNLISDALPFGQMWYEPSAISNAIGYAKFHSRSHDAAIHVYNEAGKVIERTSTPGECTLIAGDVVNPPAEGSSN